MIRRHIAYFFLISNIFGIVIAQRDVGDPCQMRTTGAQGVCRLSSDCPQVLELANNGVSPTLCAIPFLTNRYIVCCEGTQNAANSIQPNENSFLNTDNANDRFIFPDSADSSPPKKQPTYRSKSEEKCAEYTKSVTGVVSAAPLTTDPDQIVSVSIEKCENAGLSLIVGGEPASAGEFPFMAALGYNGENEIEWNCGGTLISDYYVVTAAHCTSTFNGPPVRVRLGDLDLKNDNDNSVHVDYGIAQTIVHERYRPPARYNDIALLKLSSQVEFTQFIRPACLWTKSQLEITKTIATGWGKTGVADDQSSHLLKVELNVFDNALCSKTYPPNSRTLPDGIVQTMLCAGELSGFKDTCQGDSGGPLIVTKGKNRCIFHIVGVTSFGKGCGGPNIPAVYTRISEYVPWIENKLW